jgi:putative two-component system response regulator
MLLYDAIRKRTEIAWTLVRHEEAARSAEGAEAHLANRAALCGGIIALASIIDGERGYTQGHLRRVGMYSMELGRRIGVDATQLVTLQMGGVLHDIGKAWMPRAILQKRSALTEQERATMQRHSVIGYELLKPLPGFRAVLPIVRWHHERLNGTGYPDGLAGPEVPLLTRIVSVADVFDALSTDRPYRKALTLEECKSIMTEEAHAGKLDGQLVAVLINALPELSAIRGSGSHSALVAGLMAESRMSWERTSQRRYLHECPGNLVLN